MKENQIGGACCTHGRRKRLGNLKERDHLEDQGTDGRILTIITIIIIIKWTLME